MRVGLVISDYLPEATGGTQMHVRDLARGLRARGHEVAVFAGLRGDGHDEFAVTRIEHDGVPVTRMTYNFSDFDDLEKLWQNARMDEPFREWLDALRPEIVHFHHLTGLSTRMVHTAKQLGIGVALTLHDYWMLCPRGQRIHPETLEVCEPLDRGRCLPCLARLWPHLLDEGQASAARLQDWEEAMRATIAACDRVITPSVFHRDRFVEWGVDAERIHAVEHGLSREGFAATRAERPVRDIGFIGVALPSKGVHVLIEAFEALARPELRLHVHGAIPDYHGDSGYRARLEAAASDRVVLHGAYEHSELPAILAALDVLVVPSIWWESFCLTIREGALAGVPVICSELGAMTEAVERGLAVGFEAGDAGDLARVLGRVIDDPELRARLSRGAALVRELDACVEETLAVYAACGA